MKAIKLLIANYYAEKAMDMADQIWEENGWTAADTDRLARTRMRTPYKTRGWVGINIFIKTTTTNLKIEINTNASKTKWIQFIEQKRYKNQAIHPDNLEIDFSPSSFIEPFYLVSLACVIEEYSINGTEISFSPFDKLELSEYLLSGHFFE